MVVGYNDHQKSKIMTTLL